MKAPAIGSSTTQQSQRHMSARIDSIRDKLAGVCVCVAGSAMKRICGQARALITLCTVVCVRGSTGACIEAGNSSKKGSISILYTSCLRYVWWCDVVLSGGEYLRSS